jgi:predicted nucleic acid-binding protein
VIYVDASVVLAEMLGESRRPPAGLWNDVLASSRLLQYEVWNRLQAHGVAGPLGDTAEEIFARMTLLDLDPATLARALQPFPSAVRTLDALHLASAHYLRDQGERLTVATYDRRFAAVAAALDFALEPL